jgi:RNA polymerase sigma factor (sigma-70 family)
MPAAQLDGVVRHLRRAALGSGAAPLDDASLLEQFVSRRDEGAFAALVRRHGPMVLGVCRRVLGNEADAEDAFQATFLVLVRRAATVVPRAQVGNWLYGVAHRTALKARAGNGRRRRKEHEAALAGSRSAAAAGTWGHLLEALDNELSRLPDRYRAPLVLCDLEGKSYQEAARQLGCPLGTLSGRLTRARRLLASRLGRHGPAVSAGTLAALLARHATAAPVPPLLAASTIKAAAGTAPAAVVSLTEGVVKMMMLHRLKALTAVLVLAGATVAAVGWLCQARASEPAPAADAPAPRAPAARAEPAEATFAVMAVDGRQKALAVVVAGTRGPVLSLPLKESASVLAGGRRVGPECLRVGDRVALRMGADNRLVEQVRILDGRAARRVPQAAAVAGRPSPPSLAEVLRALPRLRPGLPHIYEESRDNVQVASELILDTTEPPRTFPLVGRARLRHVHWKCTVRWVQVAVSTFPFPLRLERPQVEVIYMDKDELIPVR